MQPKKSYPDLRNQFEQYLEDTVLEATQVYPLLQEMISYHFGWLEPKPSAGKRLRPIITLLSAELFSQSVSKAYPAAAALEVLHNYTLIHDDIEDNSPMRHGQPTLWKKFGIPQAINTGDFLLSLAAIIINDAKVGRPDLLLSTFLDSSLEVTKGQHEDIRFESLETVTEKEYLGMISQKTAALFVAAMKLGAISVGANHTVIKLLGEIGYQYGIAYQMFDDHLGIWGDPGKTGKPAGIDLVEKKKSYPILLAIQMDAGFAAKISGDSSVEASCVAELINRMNQLGIRDLSKNRLKQHLQIASEKLHFLEVEHGLNVKKLAEYLNSLFPNK